MVLVNLANSPPNSKGATGSKAFLSSATNFREGFSFSSSFLHLSSYSFLHRMLITGARYPSGTVPQCTAFSSNSSPASTNSRLAANRELLQLRQTTTSLYGFRHSIAFKTLLNSEHRILSQSGTLISFAIFITRKLLLRIPSLHLKPQ